MPAVGMAEPRPDSGQSFVPSAATEQLVTDQANLIVQTYGRKEREIIADAQAESDGINAYWKANGIHQPPATVNDVIATTAFIGSIFGAGGGAEATNAELLAKLQNQLGSDRGLKAWEDAMLADDPEAPTTIKRRFDYGPLTGGKVTGSVVIDEGSIISLDPRQAPASALVDGGGYPAAGAVPAKQASNFLMVDPKRSASGNSLAVMGPQLGYYYPVIVPQIHLSGPGIEAQGAAVPGDDTPFGSVHRVELFDQFPKRVRLAEDVGVMNRAATEDTRSPVWPVVSQVLRSGPAPNALDARVVEVLDDWARRDAPRLDADNSGTYDAAGPTTMGRTLEARR